LISSKWKERNEKLRFLKLRKEMKIKGKKRKDGIHGKCDRNALTHNLHRKMYTTILFCKKEYIKSKHLAMV